MTAAKAQRHIVVVQSGWVFIGYWTPATVKRPAHITEASVIRKWGTTAGLGEIALNGVQKETILDPCGIVVFDRPEAVLFTVPCVW